MPEDDGPLDPLALDPDALDPDAGELPPPGAATGLPLFAQGGAGDLLPPGPVLAGLTDSATADPVGPSGLSDDELIGVLRAARRQVAREQYKQVLVIAEFGSRRQAAFVGAARRGLPVGCRPGGFPGEELATEMVTTPIDAGHRIDDAIDLTSRLPRTLAGMAAGLIDEDRAGWIAYYTRSLTEQDAAYADEVLAAAAPDLRVDQLARKAAALEKKLNPEGVKARRERARRYEQRVEARRELSGNASLSGREMDTADVMASKVYIDTLAARLRRGGLPGSLGSLRVQALADLTQGRDPLDRLYGASPAVPRPGQGWPPGRDADGEAAERRRVRNAGRAGGAGQHPEAGETGHAAKTGQSPGQAPKTGQSPGQAPKQVGHPGEHKDVGNPRWPGQPGGPSDPREPGGPPMGHPPGRGGPAPLPALINVIIPVGTLLGWSTAPAEAGGWGLLDYDEARGVTAAAARHPRTRWCATLTAPDGTTLAHGCAAGQHPSLLDHLGPQDHPSSAPPGPGNHQPGKGTSSSHHPPPGSREPQDRASPQPRAPGNPHAEPPHAQPPSAGQVPELLRSLGLAFTSLARGSCDHSHAETGYTPSRKLRHLIRARNATCDAPGCEAPAVNADLDHTLAWPDGPTDECNLAPRCRTHHRAKQAPDWTVEQTAPGVTRWTMPSGRIHTTTPTKYET
jgi:hypothetical protein